MRSFWLNFASKSFVSHGSVNCIYNFVIFHFVQSDQISSKSSTSKDKHSSTIYHPKTLITTLWPHQNNQIGVFQFLSPQLIIWSYKLKDSYLIVLMGSERCDWRVLVINGGRTLFFIVTDADTCQVVSSWDQYCGKSRPVCSKFLFSYVYLLWFRMSCDIINCFHRIFCFQKELGLSEFLSKFESFHLPRLFSVKFFWFPKKNSKRCFSWKVVSEESWISYWYNLIFSPLPRLPSMCHSMC